jgi:hypothetical protein
VFAVVWWYATCKIGWAHCWGFHFHHSLFGLLAFVAILFWSRMRPCLLAGPGCGYRRAHDQDGSVRHETDCGWARQPPELAGEAVDTAALGCAVIRRRGICSRILTVTCAMAG